MKKIKLMFASLFALLAMLSCNDDGGDSKLSLQTGAVPDIRKVEGTPAIINLLEIQEGNDISISFSTKIAQGNVSSIDIVAFYYKGTAFEKVTLAENVTTFPLTITLSKQDLIDKFSLLNADEDFILGDRLRVSADLVLSDGTAVKLLNDDGSQNFGPDISNASIYNVTTTYIVSCPSDLGGEYTSITSGSSTDSGPTPDENPISNYTSTVTLTDNGGGSYTISDPYAGLYNLWYDIYGITPGFNVSGTITDVCGTISGNFPEPFGGATTVDGVVNEDGTISYTWINDFGDTGTVVLTKVQ